jgi:hypothetical protein
VQKSTRPRPFAFVLMPFDKSFDDTFELAIEPACDAAGAYAERVDQQIFTGSILDRVYNQIAKADIVVADMSERNPNVFYEVGYAHALGKTTILLTRDAADIPFDLKHYPHIVYGNRLKDLRSELERRARWHIENPSMVDASTETMGVRVNGIELGTGPSIDIPILTGRIGFEVRVELHNIVARVLRSVSCKVGLFTPPEFVSAAPDNMIEYTSVLIDARTRLHLPPHHFTLLPEAWDIVKFLPCTDNRTVVPGEQHNFGVRIFLDSGCTDFPFQVTTVTPADAG